MVMLMPGLGRDLCQCARPSVRRPGPDLGPGTGDRGEYADRAAAAVELILLVFGEFIIGIYFGLLARMLLLTLDTTGRIVAFSTGLAAAQVFNPSSTGQGLAGPVFVDARYLDVLRHRHASHDDRRDGR